jgi:hypothetical protein
MSNAILNTEQTFWAWFQQHDAVLFDFESQPDRVFAAVATALAAVAADLTFEFGPLVDGRRDFVISAGGIRSAFAAVTTLAAAAPVLPRWNVIAFRQRRVPILGVKIGELAVRPKEVEFSLLSNELKLGIQLFFDKYRDDERTIWGQIGYLFLDQALGEYDVETKVGLIEFFPSSAHPEAVRYPLHELPMIFDARFAELPPRH